MIISDTGHFSRSQRGWISWCNQTNSRLDTTGRALGAMSGAAEIGMYARQLNGKTSDVAQRTVNTLGVINSSLTAARVPLNAVYILSGGIFFRSNPDGTFLRAQRDHDGHIIKDEETGAMRHDPNAKITWKHPFSIFIDIAVRVGHFVTTLGFLNNRAYHLNEKTASGVGKATNITWGIVSTACVADSIKMAVTGYNEMAQQKATFRDKIDSLVRSILDMISWVFDTVANYGNPKLGIAGGVIHFITGAYWFVSDLWSFGPALETA